MTTIVDLEKMAAGWEPKIRDAFLQAIQQIAGNVDIVALQRLIEKGDVAGALAAVGVDAAHFNTLVLAHAAMFNTGGLTVAQSIPPLQQAAGYAVRVLFDVRNPRAEQWVRQRSSTLVQEIVDDQRVAIRDYLEKGLQAGQNPRTVALDLVGRISPATRQRTGGIIGLHSTQERWLANYERDLASTDPAALRSLLDRGLRDKRFDRTVLKAIQDGTALPADVQSKMRTAYANRALKWRADNIARTETIRALGASQTEAYQQAIDKGQLDQSLIQRFWITAGDDRVRPTHRQIPEMNKDGVKWNQPFATPDGPSLHAPHDFDPQCRCLERVRVDFLAKAVAKARASRG